ncbi:MAG: PIN domain-containing protein [Baekduiaceae bacterium]
MTAAVADTSVFIAREAGRPIGDLPEVLAISVITAAELELGVLRATGTTSRAQRLATLSAVRAACPLLPIDAEVASCFSRLAATELEAGRRLRRHDTWIAATALRHGVPVVTQHADFSSFSAVEVIRV